MDTTASAQAHLEEYILDDPLGLQRITASALLGGDYGERDRRTLRSIVLALVSHHKTLQAAARQGIVSTSVKNYNEYSARLSAVRSVLHIGVEGDLLTILDNETYDRFVLNTAYHVVSSIVSADPDIRQDVETLLTELNP